MNVKSKLNNKLPQIGEIIECKGGYQVEVLKLLATGPFSDVYKVHGTIDKNECYAMKVEKRNCFR